MQDQPRNPWQEWNAGYRREKIGESQYRDIGTWEKDEEGGFVVTMSYLGDVGGGKKMEYPYKRDFMDFYRDGAKLHDYLDYGQDETLEPLITRYFKANSELYRGRPAHTADRMRAEQEAKQQENTKIRIAEKQMVHANFVVIQETMKALVAAHEDEMTDDQKRLARQIIDKDYEYSHEYKRRVQEWRAARDAGEYLPVPAFESAREVVESDVVYPDMRGAFEAHNTDRHLAKCMILRNQAKWVLNDDQVPEISLSRMIVGDDMENNAVTFEVNKVGTFTFHDFYDYAAEIHEKVKKCRSVPVQRENPGLLGEFAFVQQKMRELKEQLESGEINVGHDGFKKDILQRTEDIAGRKNDYTYHHEKREQNDNWMFDLSEGQG